jgi:hypothetical protein
MWWHPDRGWRKDAFEAKWFASKEDAESYIAEQGLPSGLLVTDHYFE